MGGREQGKRPKGLVSVWLSVREATGGIPPGIPGKEVGSISQMNLAVSVSLGGPVCLYIPGMAEATENREDRLGSLELNCLPAQG